MTKARQFVQILVGAMVAGFILSLSAEFLVPRVKSGLAERSSLRRLERHWSSAAADAAVIVPGSEAGLTLIEFGDYLCEACREAHNRLLQSLPDESALRVLYRHSPNINNPASVAAAIAAICANEQNAFRRMHDQLMTFDYSNEPIWSVLATVAGVGDLDKFQRCLASSEAREGLVDDRSIASNLGVRGTPTFVTQRFIGTGIPPIAWLDSLARVSSTVENRE